MDKIEKNVLIVLVLGITAVFFKKIAFHFPKEYNFDYGFWIGWVISHLFFFIKRQFNDSI